MTAPSQLRANAAYRQRLKARGYRPTMVYVHEEDRPMLLEIVRDWRRARLGEDDPPDDETPRKG